MAETTALGAAMAAGNAAGVDVWDLEQTQGNADFFYPVILEEGKTPICLNSSRKFLITSKMLGLLLIHSGHSFLNMWLIGV